MSVSDCSKNCKCMSFVKVEIMKERLFWIALDCTGVPNKLASEGRTWLSCLCAQHQT